MASDSKLLPVVLAELRCFCCNDFLRVEKDIRNSSQNTLPNSSSLDLENLQDDMSELNKVLSVVKSCSVKDSVLAEIDLISAKISSLLAPTTTDPNKEPLWTEVVKGKKKITTSQHQGPFNTPVINNRYNLLPISKKCEDSETISSSAVQQKSAKKYPSKKRTKL
jgi:hypothetical protein